MISRFWRLLAWAATLAVSFAAAPSMSAETTAPPLLDSLQRYCVQTDARFDDVQAAAAELTPMGDRRPPMLENAKGWIDPVKTIMVAAGDAPTVKKLGGFHTRGCMVLGRHDIEPKALNDAVRHWLAVDPYERDSDHILYLVEKSPSGWLSVEGRSDDQMKALAVEGRLYAVLLVGDANTNVLLFSAYAPDSTGSAGGLTGGDPFEDFKSICVAHAGKPEDSLKAADTAGWMQAPDLVKKSDLYPLVAGDVRLRSTDNDMELMTAGDGRMQIDLQILRFKMCAIGQAPPADRSLLAAVQDWVGVPPAQSTPGDMQIYLLVDDGGHHRSLAGPHLAARLEAEMRKGPVTVVVTLQGRGSRAVAVVVIGQLTQVKEVRAETADHG